jgi:hypothetical protein
VRTQTPGLQYSITIQFLLIKETKVEQAHLRARLLYRNFIESLKKEAAIGIKLKRSRNGRLPLWKI